MARGNAREAIYLDDGDRQSFLDSLVRACERFDWALWAYCLMDNHYHLLVETRRPTLSRGMREVNGVYTQGFNRRHRRGGHVLQGRFKAILVDRDSYLLEVSRYIVLNPVQAGMCDSAADWPWSSYPAVMGKAAALPSLQVDATLALFGTQTGPARRAYARFVAEGGCDSGTRSRSLGAGFSGRRIVHCTGHAQGSGALTRSPKAAAGVDFAGADRTSCPRARFCDPGRLCERRIYAGPDWRTLWTSLCIGESNRTT